MTAARTPSAITTAARFLTRTTTRRVVTAAAAGLGGAAIVAVSMTAAGGAADAAVQVNCAATPSACGFPDATTTGVPAGTTLLAVPGQISSGPGWSFSAASQSVNVTGANAVLSGLSIPYNVNITASGVTIKNDKITTSQGFAVSLRHLTGVTIQNSTISGLNATTGRVDSAISDLYQDSTGITIKNNNISAFRTAVQVTSGLVSGNYIHDPGYIAGDHTNGVMVGGSTAALTITGNTILNNLGQTDAINLDSNTTGYPVANKTITGNLLTGGSYTIYGGNSLSNPTSGIVIQNNRFGQTYYPKAGQFGPAAYYTATGTGNSWTGNVWDATGLTVPSP